MMEQLGEACLASLLEELLKKRVEMKHSPLTVSQQRQERDESE